MLISIETHITMVFQGGGSGPPIPPLDPHMDFRLSKHTLTFKLEIIIFFVGMMQVLFECIKFGILELLTLTLVGPFKIYHNK